VILIKCEGKTINRNGRCFRKPSVGEVIPVGHLRRGSGHYYLSDGCVVCVEARDMVEVPTPIGEPFERTGRWWQQIVPVLIGNTEVLTGPDGGEKIVVRVGGDKEVYFADMAIPCDAPDDVIQSRVRVWGEYPMTLGDLWDLDLWVKNDEGLVRHGKSLIGTVDETVRENLMVSRSHRGEWYPPTMPWEGDCPGMGIDG